MTSSTPAPNLNITHMNTTLGTISSPATTEVAVKVAVRVRPLNNREKLHQHQPCVKISTETNQIVIGKDKVFTFDHVIPPKTTQAELYETCVKNLVHSLFEGYNATVFAYGQTGSGKTHTITGNKSTVDEYGIIPRAVHSMFQIINSSSNSPLNSANSQKSNRMNYTANTNNNKEYCVKVNFIEIYKEELKDLLDQTEKDLQIREDELGQTIIYGANEVICNTLEEVMACFDAGNNLRQTGSTLMNEQSSRSHSVFTISIEQRWSDNSSKTLRDSSTLYDLNHNNGSNSLNYLGAKFHFVDLAGSERVNRTGNVGDRFKESVHINSGLLALGNVISALSSNDSKKKTHIPYRESKITRILKDSLGGNANTLMICCISPSSCNLDESINALKYASRARYIKNKPIVNLDPQSQRFVEMQSEIQALREELHRQRTALMSAKYQGDNANHHIENNELELRLENTEIELDHYKKLAKDAYNRFKQLNKIDNTNSGLNKSNSNMRKLIDEWISMFETNEKTDLQSEDYNDKEKIIQLEMQLKKAYDDLKSDEEIFTDKEKEINSLKDIISDLEVKLANSNHYLEAAYLKEKEQKELMLQLQMQLDKLMQNKSINDSGSIRQNLSNINSNQVKHSQQSVNQIINKSASQSNIIENSSLGNNANKQRAKTAPNSELNENKINENNKRNRAVYSSPALFNLERIMQSFRARSQLLTETLEENDCVMTKKSKSTYDIDKENLYNDANNKINEEDFVESNEEENNVEGEGNFVRKGTFKVNKPKSKSSAQPQSEILKTQNDNIKKTTTNLIRKNSDTAPITVNNLQEANKKLRDLNINIRMKEELIKELVVNSKFTNRINQQYQHKIESLEKESNRYKNEINDLEHRLHELLANGTNSNRDQNKIELELRKKLEQANSKINDLEIKQMNNQKALNATTNSDKKITELELSLTKMRQQNELLQKKIKEENEKKIRIEKDFEREQKKLKDLEMKADQQQKIIKKKTEDLASVKQRLRSGSGSGPSGQASPDDVNKHWVEQEMEKIFQEKQQMELLRDELHNREELIKKKEILIEEKNQLMLKKMQSSQQNRESLQIIEKKLENLSSNNKQTSMKELEETHSNLIKQRKTIEKRLTQGDILSPIEERRLIEIEEAIEAIEIAIDYENETIINHKNKLKDSILLNEDNKQDDESKKITEHVLSKLSTVPYEETQNLVKKFFQKIINLKENEQRFNMENSELKMQLDEQNRLVEQLKLSVNGAKSELEKKLIEQKNKTENNNKFLTQQLNDCNSKIEKLEKEILIYKEKLIHLKSKQQNNDSNVKDSSGFYLKSNNLSSRDLNGKNLNNNIDQSQYGSSSASTAANSTKLVKVSRKDLRQLTEEELLKRSMNKKDESNENRF